MVWPDSSAVEQEPFKLLVLGSNPSRVTDRDFPEAAEIWLWLGWVSQSSAKPRLNSGTSRRSVKKKFEPTVFAPIAKSEHVFFARAIFAHDSALPTHCLIGSSQLEPLV